MPNPLVHHTIRTAYRHPSQKNGARIMAESNLHGTKLLRIYMSYDHSLSLESNHAVAARNWAARYHIAGGSFMEPVGQGQLRDGSHVHLLRRVVSMDPGAPGPLDTYESEVTP